MQGADAAGRRVLVLADGAAPDRAALDAAWRGWDDRIDAVVAADGGARLAGPLGLAIDRWVGDGDSLGADAVEALRAAGVRVDLARRDKDETDSELALLAATEVPGVGRITILGALGGPRVDHALANVGLLGHPAAAGLAVEILDPGARIRLLDAGMTGPGSSMDLGGRTGDLVSLIPLGEVDGVVTSGLRYPLRGEPLPPGLARGISNVREDAHAAVTIRSGRLLVVEVPATLRT
ncbi:MAG: thiamine diphosphokinase [Candidatus Limnocylindrales bacterium]